MDRIEIRELECFTAVAENLSFSKAARLLHMTQPPLSRQIRKLEEKLGVELFFRDKHRVDLTPEGQIFYEESLSLLRHADRVSQTIHLAQSGRLSVFKVGFLGALLDDRIVSLLKEFRQRMPGCQVSAHEVTLATVEEHLRNREVDGAFIASAPDVRGSEFGILPWRVPSYKVLLSSEHPLAQRKELRLKDLADEKWTMVSRKSAPFFRKQFVDACVKQGFHPQIVHESDRLPATLAMVALGEAIGLISHENMLISLPHLVLKPLIGGVPKIEHVFVYRKDDNAPALTAFRELLKRQKK